MARKDQNAQMLLDGTEEAELLNRLSERVEHAVGAIDRLRKERDELKAKLEETEAKLNDEQGKLEAWESMQKDHERFVEERSEIRSRIETILDKLEKLDELTSSDS